MKEMTLAERLASHFGLQERGGWTALNSPLARAAGMKSGRVGKWYRGGQVYFTFGETETGRGMGLTERIQEIVREAGLRPISMQSTNGSRPDKIYWGFDGRQAKEEQVEAVLAGVERLLQAVAEGR